jgi:pyrrolysine biosynthesis protein PylC
VVGGNLQGIEVCYLARKAGWEVVLIDRCDGRPASGLCDRHLQIDVTAEDSLGRSLEGVDLVIPALEDSEALSSLVNHTREAGVPFTYDPNAYAVSSCKESSNRLFSRIGIEIPQPWPDCGFPVVAKPGNSSGSRDVCILRNEDEYKRIETEVGGFDGWILQEFIQGKQFSIEVIGAPGEHRAVQITDLEVDEFHDCKRVLAPTSMSPELGAAFEDLSIEIAEALKLKGIMDVEAIVRDEVLKVLEVDARIPSQTPTAVYWSSGLNLVEELAGLFLSHPQRSFYSLSSPRAVIYEHIRVSPDLLEVAGEHIMSRTDSLHLVEGFFGANEAITNYSPGRNEWVATLIFSGTDGDEAWRRREEAIRDIRGKFRLSVYRDGGFLE